MPQSKRVRYGEDPHQWMRVLTKEGEGAKRVWIVLHGGVGEASNWRRVLPLMPPQDRYFVVELPGHGGSPWYSGLSWSGLEKALRIVVKELLKESQDLPLWGLAHSMGGPLLLDALSHLERTPEGCILANTSLRFSNKPLKMVFSAVAPLANPFHYWFPYRLGADSEVAGFLVDEWLRCWNIQKVAQEVSYPTVVIGSLMDPIVPVWDSYLLAKEIPGADFLLCKKGNHVSIMDCPEMIVQAYELLCRRLA